MATIRALICALFLLNGCGEHTKPSSSVDATALQAIVKLPIPMKSVKWEIFHYPENVGGLMPANIDSTMLIAEIEPSDPKWLEHKQTPIKVKWLGSNDARPWISPAFRTMLSTETIDLKKYNCAYYETTRLATGDKINGFACELGGRVLLYLLLNEQA